MRKLFGFICKQLKIMGELTIRNNEANQQFEVEVDGELAYLSYRFHKGEIALMHTEVPKSLGGKGIASALAEHAMEFAREHKMPVMVYCPFVAAWLKRHPGYQGLVDAKYRG
jgi:predicted GNAT family acetyltransferase